MKSALTSVELRPTRLDDAPALAALMAGIGWFQAYEGQSAEQASAHVAALLQEALPQSRSLLTVAEHPELGLCGYCAVHWLPLTLLQGWEAYVSELFISEAARGLGVGTQLLDHAVQAARERRCARIWLLNNRERDSYQTGFYAKRGWREYPQLARFVLNLDTQHSPA